MKAWIPVALVMAMRSTLYNGIRHLIFVLPPLAVVAGLALDRLFRLATRRQARGMVAALALWGGWHASLLIRLHPYQYVYANLLAGGMPGANDYELDFWGESLREGAFMLANHVATLPARAKPYRVFVCPNPASAAPFLPPSIMATNNPAGADFALMAVTPLCASPVWALPARDLGRVTRCGATLAVLLGLEQKPHRRH